MPENDTSSFFRVWSFFVIFVAEGDFVFLLGFPGTTMRYAPSSRLAYADEVAVPALVAKFARKLLHIREHSTERAISLKLCAALLLQLNR